MLLGLLTALYFQRRCHVTRRDRQLGLQLPLICRKAAQLWSCQESRSQSLSLTHTSTDCTKRTWLQKRPPPGKLEGFLRSTVYTYTQWPLIFLPPVILDKHKDTPLSIYLTATKAFSSCKQTFSSPFHFMVFLVSKHVSKHKALMMLD